VKGERFSAVLEYAGIGGTNYFLKPSIGGTAYLPFLRNRYFGLHFEAGYAHPLAGRDLPIFEPLPARRRAEHPRVRHRIDHSTASGIGNEEPDYVDEQGRILAETSTPF